MASIMTLTLISCDEAKDENEQSLNDNQISENITEGDNKESNKNTEANKISKVDCLLVTIKSNYEVS